MHRPGDEIVVEWRALTIPIILAIAELAAIFRDGSRPPAAGRGARGRHLVGGTQIAARNAPAAPADPRRLRRHGVLNQLEPFMPDNVTVVDHPLVLHKLSLMRDKHTPSAVFRQLVKEISLLLAYEVLRDLPMTTRHIETPMAEMEAPILRGKKLVIVSILRAGNGLLDGMLDLVPSARSATWGSIATRRR
jgi:hypothetical protein